MANSRTLDNQAPLARGFAGLLAGTLPARLKQWLEGDPLAFSARPLTLLELERARAAQLNSTQRGALAPMAAVVFSAAALTIGMWDTSVRAPLVMWAAALLLNFALWRALRRKGAAGRAIGALRRAALRSALNAVIWGLGLVIAQSAADDGQRGLIATLSMCVMSGGALQLSVSPLMAYGFIAPLALGCMIAACETPSAMSLPILAAQFINVGFLALQSHLQAARLARRTIAHFEDATAARLDPLTGLGNRLGVRERLALDFERLAKGGDRFALMCFDLDDFQLVNGTFGHSAGDELILRAAQILRATTREGDYFARLGGGEFALIAAHTGNREIAQALAKRIAAEFRRPHAFTWGESACSMTIGAAVAPENGHDGVHLVRAAEAALYRAKRRGRGAIAFVDDADSREESETRKTEAALRRALHNGEMRLDFQPIVDAASGAISGFEALLRWRRPGFPEAPADDFIRVAESCGCLDEMGVWALREATRVAATWPKRLRVAVNVSAAELKAPSLLAAVREIAAGGFESRRLELEISHSALIEDFEAAAASLNALRNYGVSIALDALGAQFSSMSSIAKLPLDRIKIDRAFVADA
ncbi:MAG: EAL domain-containing protein, partial [Hyphomicrobiales bacterium]|nr:EAL domain-containing protein [Hyphomicrobiales bacterium]